MTVLLMADLTRLAWKARLTGNPRPAVDLLDGFLSQLGGSGTLLIPTYNFDLLSDETFDVRRTPPITGALGVAALHHPAFRRTAHPFHSFAVAGAHADLYLQLNDPSSFGPASPFAVLHKDNAQLVALDLTLNDVLTTAHYAEEVERVAYRRWRTVNLHYIDAQDLRQLRAYKRFAKRPGHSNEMSALSPLLEQRGAMHAQEVDGHRLLRIDVRKAHDVVVQDIRMNNARNIHRFSWDRFVRDLLRSALRRDRPSRSARLLDAHAAG